MQARLPIIAKWIYALSALAFLAGVVAQVFLAGLAVVARTSGWDLHVVLGHGLGLFLLLMLISMFPARLPVPVRWLSFLLFAVYFVQADVVIFMRDSAPYLAALHPVFALVDFLLALHVFRAVLRELKNQEGSSPAGMASPAGLGSPGEV